jgi:hypothetical protein
VAQCHYSAIKRDRGDADAIAEDADVVLACAHACLERTIHSVESRILVAQRRRPGAWSNVAFLSYAREKWQDV